MTPSPLYLVAVLAAVTACAQDFSNLDSSNQCDDGKCDTYDEDGRWEPYEVDPDLVETFV